MHILVAGGGELRSKSTWSGTSYAIISALEKRNHIVDTYDVFEPINKHVAFVIKILGKFVYWRQYARSFALNTICEKSLDKFLKGKKFDCILFIAESVYVKRCDTPVYVYMDAVLGPLLEQYPYKRDKKVPLFGFFYNKYCQNDKKALMRANCVFSETDWVRNYLLGEYHINPNKLQNIGCGVNLNPLSDVKSYDENLLLIVLRKGVEKLKGLYLLLEAFRIAKKTIPSVKLAIVGTDLGGEEGVSYYYNQSRSVTVDLFKRCTLYTMPALGEPNGVTYLEALANKSPIVGLNRFAFPEFAGYGKYGFICKNEDPNDLASVIIDALSDKERLARMGEAGQRFVMERYSWDIVVDKMIAEISRDCALAE